MTSAMERLARERGPDGRPVILPPFGKKNIVRGRGVRGGSWCGTPAGYNAGCRCGDCKLAMRDKQRLARARRSET